MTVTLHQFNFGVVEPAINVKYHQRIEVSPAIRAEFDRVVAPFRHQPDELIQEYAMEAWWEHAQEIVGEIFGEGYTAVAKGRMGGWLALDPRPFNITDWEVTDPETLALIEKWEKLEIAIEEWRKAAPLVWEQEMAHLIEEMKEAHKDQIREREKVITRIIQSIGHSKLSVENMRQIVGKILDDAFGAIKPL